VTSCNTPPPDAATSGHPQISQINQNDKTAVTIVSATGSRQQQAGGESQYDLRLSAKSADGFPEIFA
jgi:hypothetical protein